MGVMKCGKCGTELSGKAGKCPKCGAPVKKKGAGLGTVLLIFLAIFISAPLISALFARVMTSRADVRRAKQADERILAQTIAREKLLQEFNENKKSILLYLNGLLDEKKYKEVIEKAEPYLSLDDTEVTRISKKAEELSLLAELKKVAASNLDRKYQLYVRLENLDPTRKKYYEKIQYYREKLLEKRRIKK